MINQITIQYPKPTKSYLERYMEEESISKTQYWTIGPITPLYHEDMNILLQLLAQKHKLLDNGYTNKQALGALLDNILKSNIRHLTVRNQIHNQYIQNHPNYCIDMLELNTEVKKQEKLFLEVQEQLLKKENNFINRLLSYFKKKSQQEIYNKNQKILDEYLNAVKLYDIHCAQSILEAIPDIETKTYNTVSEFQSNKPKKYNLFCC